MLGEDHLEVEEVDVDVDLLDVHYYVKLLLSHISPSVNI